MPETSNAIVVLGMHRTGTSLTMAALEALGVDAGSHLLPPGPDNETGYWEDKSVIDLNDRLLAVMGKTWYSLAPITESDWALAEVDNLRCEAAALLKNHFAHSTSWGFKDPRCLRLWPFWRRVLNEMGVPVKCVVTYRHPESVAASLAHRNQFAPARSYFLWLAHYVPFLDQLLSKPCIFIDYDQFIDQPTEVMDRLTTFVHGAGGLGQQMGLVNAFLKRTLQGSLRHARFESQEISTQAPSILRDACSVLDQLAKGDDRPGTERKVVALQKDYESYAMLLRQIDASQSQADKLGSVVREEEPIREKIEKMGLYQADIGIKMEQIDTRHASQAKRAETLSEGLDVAIQRLETQQGLLSGVQQLTQALAEKVQGVQDKVVIQLDEFHRAPRPEVLLQKLSSIQDLSQIVAERAEVAQHKLDDQQAMLSGIWEVTQALSRRVEDVQEKVVIQLDEFHRELQGETLLQRLAWQKGALSDMQEVTHVLSGRMEDVQEKVVVQLDEFYRSLKKELGHAESVRVEELTRNLVDARSQIDGIYRSTSWRFTKPLRAMKAIARRILRR